MYQLKVWPFLSYQLIKTDHITSDVFLCLYRVHGVSYYPTISVELPSDSNIFQNL